MKRLTRRERELIKLLTNRNEEIKELKEEIKELKKSLGDSNMINGVLSTLVDEREHE